MAAPSAPSSPLVPSSSISAHSSTQQADAQRRQLAAPAASMCAAYTPPLLSPLRTEPAAAGGCGLDGGGGGGGHGGLCAPPPACACLAAGSLIALRSEPKQRFLASFPGGGEVFAIGNLGREGRLGRIPLGELVFEVEAAPPAAARARNGTAAASTWVGLRHLKSRRRLVMEPAAAREGAWMVRLLDASRATSRGIGGGVGGGDPREVFCVDPSHGLYSLSSEGYVNLRGEVLLRGHDAPNRPAARVASSRVRAFSVGRQTIREDAECGRRARALSDSARLVYGQRALLRRYWRCKRRNAGGAGGGVGGSRWRRRRGLGSGIGADTSAAGSADADADAGEGKLRVLTFATRSTPMFCDSLLVSMLAEVPLTLLGYGEA